MFRSFKKPEPLRVMFAGASGTGKTTLCNLMSTSETPFISGSVSQLLPDTEKLKHEDMLSRDPEVLQREDYQVLNLRNKLYSQYTSFISDRSYVDSAAYFIYKQADKLPQCELEQFIGLCQMALAKQCTHLIFIPFTPVMFKEWVIEDNNKRILSKYFQTEISYIMEMALKLMGYTRTAHHQDMVDNPFHLKLTHFSYGWDEGEINTIYGRTKVLTLLEPGLEERQRIIAKWLRKN